MLSTELSTVLLGIGLLFCLICCAWCLREAIIAKNQAIGALNYVEKRNTNSLSLKRMTEIQAELQEQHDSIEKIHEMLHKLRSRQGMRDHRARKKEANSDGIPDSTTDPAGYKAAMRVKLAAKNF